MLDDVVDVGSDRHLTPLRVVRVALLADFLEEGWPSMDLVADSLREALDGKQGMHFRLQCELVRPPMRRRFSQPAQTAGRAFSIDRFLNRLSDYPRFVSKIRGSFDLFHVVDHSYSQLIHKLPAGRTLVTCHDLDTFRSVYDSSVKRSSFFRAMARHILSGFGKAAFVFCDSAATRDALLTNLGVEHSKTAVVHLGLRPAFLKSPGSAAEKSVDSLLNRSSDAVGLHVNILHVGSTIPRKRIDVLLDVFGKMRDEDGRLRLIRVGGQFTPAQHERARTLGLLDHILILPFLSEGELAALYRRSALVLQPSEAEGFGFPIIEALACGTPVLASDLPVLREVGGTAAVYAPVGNTVEWVQRARSLLMERQNDPVKWAGRQNLCRQRGREFSWGRTADAVFRGYERVLAEC